MKNTQQNSGQQRGCKTAAHTNTAHTDTARPDTRSRRAGSLKLALAAAALCALTQASARTPDVLAAANALGQTPFAMGIGLAFPKPGSVIPAQTWEREQTLYRSLERGGIIKIQTVPGGHTLALTPTWPGPRPEAGRAWEKYAPLKLGTFTPRRSEAELISQKTGLARVRVFGTFTFSPWVKPSKALLPSTVKQLSAGVFNATFKLRSGRWQLSELSLPNN